MNKLKTYLIIAAMFVVVFFLQNNFFTWFNIAGVMPNLFVVLVLFVSLYSDKKLGVVVGIIIGFLLDVLIGKTVGFSSLFFAIIGLIGEYFDRNFSKDSRIMIIIMTAISTVIYEIGMYFVSIAKFHLEVEVFAFIKILLIEVLFNVLLVIILYTPIKKLGYHIESLFKGKQLLTRYF